MKTFKKGDWVVFPEYNEYPIQLEEDGKWGLFYYNFSGSWFVELPKNTTDVPLSYCVSDPRQFCLGKRYSYNVVINVRYAKKSDLQKIQKAVENQYDMAKKELLKINKALKEFNF